MSMTDEPQRFNDGHAHARRAPQTGSLGPIT